MPEPVESQTVTFRPLGQDGEADVRQVAETPLEPDASYATDGRREILRYNPKTPDEANALRRFLADLRHRNLVTRVGLALICLVTLAALASFLGITYSTAPNAHEDAVRLLILIIGAVLGAVFGAIASDKDKG